MILHDRCDFTVTETDQFGNRAVVDIVENVPCELSPINSEPADSSGPIKTRYLFVTGYDMSMLARGTIGVTYRGQTLTFEAGFEQHRMLGRFHHIEAIVADFGL